MNLIITNSKLIIVIVSKFLSFVPENVYIAVSVTKLNNM